MAVLAYIFLLITLSVASCMNIMPDPDWLISKEQYPTKVVPTDQNTVLLTNGLLAREFSITPDFATIRFDEQHTAKSAILRALSPEAVVALDGVTYTVGGLKSSMPRAYFNKSALHNDARAMGNSFHYQSHKVGKPVAPYPYTPKRGAPTDTVWPPAGVNLQVFFKAPDTCLYQHRDVIITVTYEMYDNIPALVKWVTVTSPTRDVSVQVLSVEYLAVNQPWAKLNPNADGPGTGMNNEGYEMLFVQTSWAHGSQVTWGTDPSAPAMPGSFQPVVNVSYSTAFPIPLATGHNITSFRVIETATGTSEPIRATLSRHRVFRTLVPQTQENPIFFHMTSAESLAVRHVIDQMAEVGFEMLIYSFGSGLDMESDNDTYIKKVAEDVAYAKSKGIEVGSYDLIVWTRTPPVEFRTIDPATGKTTGNSCIASGWYEHLRDRIINFMKRTGLMMIETDGPYPGYECASTNHSHHTGLDDSVYRQTEFQNMLYSDFAQEGFFVNQPDYYFFQGPNKTPLGYSEHQFSLPRWQDLSVSRQGMMDDLMWRVNTQGWMFMPLTVYHGGGAAAVFEPLTAHAEAYAFGMAQYLGAGVAACYRGFRLYDSPVTQAIVTDLVSFYKRYRPIIASDVIPIRRPDMQGLDGFVHVNPKLDTPALAMVFNPTDELIAQNFTVPLYYAGLTGASAGLSELDGPVRPVALDRWAQATFPVVIKPRQFSWFVFTRP